MNNKYVYILTFKTYGTNMEQIYSESFRTRKDAEHEKTILRSCGHTNIKISKTVVYLLGIDERSISMKVIKKNLPKGVKKQFGKVKGVKVKFVANDKHKKAK